MFCVSCYRNYKCEAGLKAIAEFSRKIKREKMWVMQGYGGSFVTDKFKLFVDFCVYDQLYTLPEAREILVNAVEDFLVYLNNNEKVREYIPHFPLTYKDIELAISFRDSKKIFVPEQYISRVVVMDGDVFYSIWKYDGYHHDPKTIHREAYKDTFHVVKVDPSYTPKPLRLPPEKASSLQ